MNNNKDNLNQITSLINDAGGHCDYGGNESELDYLIDTAQSKYPDKGVCAVKNWVWWDLDVDEKGQQYFASRCVHPSIIYAKYVIWDKFNRWPQGSYAKTTLLFNFEEECFFITTNTVYILVGPGTRKTVAPDLVASIQF